MKIRKPWRSREEVENLEREIIKISRDVENHYIDLARYMSRYKSSYIFNKRLTLNSQLADSRELAYRLNSSYWFSSQFHPDYEAIASRVKLVCFSIGKELVRRRERGYRSD